MSRTALRNSSLQPVRPQLRVDHVSHFEGLILEILQQFEVIIVTGAAGEKQQVLGLVLPRLEPIRSRGKTPEDESFETVEGVAGKCHG